MALLKNKLLWVSLLGVVLSGGLLVVVVGYLGLVVYTGVMTGTPIVGELLDVAVPTIVAVALLVVLLVLSGFGVVWTLVRNASLPKSARVASLAGRLEREYAPLRTLGLSDLFAPPEPSADERAERALADLKRQYVDGEISEAEFERKVDGLVANDSIDEVRAARERRRVVADDADG